MAYERKFDVDRIIEKLLRGKNIRAGQFINVSETDMKDMCRISREIFLGQPMLLEMSSPVKIFSDIHGQYYDLLRIFDMCGYPPNSNYLFLGDAVDRGKQSLETICLLLCYKIKYPDQFFLLRGNHESASISRIYGFYDECKRRHNIRLWKTFMDCFNCLPVAAIVENQIFCCHGGLSPYLRTMNDILVIQRPTDVPDKGILCDLLWSDPGTVKGDISGSDLTMDVFPQAKPGTKDDQDKTIVSNGPNAKIIAAELLSRGFGSNDRGVSFTFNATAVNKFLAEHKLRLVCRGHQVVEDGYEFFANRTLVTIFSAPNYCGEFDNAGAVMNVDASLLCSFQILKPPSKARLVTVSQGPARAPTTPVTSRNSKKTKSKTK